MRTSIHSDSVCCKDIALKGAATTPLLTTFNCFIVYELTVIRDTLSFYLIVHHFVAELGHAIHR